MACGFAVGPRYLVPSLPFLAVPAALGIAATWRRPIGAAVAVVAMAWSFFATWSEAIAGQSFPDYTANPLFALSLPRLLSGDVARNVGMLLGLSGWRSLVPLVVVIAAALALALAPAGAARLPGRETVSSLREEQTWA